MPKPKIKIENLLKDLDDVFKLVERIEEDNSNIQKISLEANRLKNNFEKKYLKYMQMAQLDKSLKILEKKFLVQDIDQDRIMSWLLLKSLQE